MTHRFFFVVSGLFVCYARISRTISWLLRFFRYARIPRSVSCLVCLFVTLESRALFHGCFVFFVTRKSRAVFHVWFVCLLQKNMTHRFFFVVSGLFVCYARISRTISWLLRFFRYARIPRSVSCLVCLFVTQESRKYFFSGLFACLLVREIQNTFVSVIERSTQASILMTISWICRIN